ncbi:MAG: hypothetical protein RL687_92 [Candidatus Parcubacteria bacterium]|jgi:hypothetical protein
MENTNPNQNDGETSPQVEPTSSSFSGFTEDYSREDHLKAEKAGIDTDLEFSKRCGKPRKVGEPIVDDSHFSGVEQKPFDSVVKPNPESKNDNLDLPKGSDYRKENNSSLL